MKSANVEVSDILPLAITVVVAGVGIAFGIDVLDSTRDDFCNAGTVWDDATRTCHTPGCATGAVNRGFALNATNDTISGVAKFSDKMGLIATVIIAAIVIGLLVRFLFQRM